MYIVLICNDIVKHTEFYQGQLRSNVTFTGHARCFKMSFTIVFIMMLYGVCYENVYS
jgi:hypothetical protein